MKIYNAKTLIEEGERIPKFYGISYYEFNRNVFVCYIFPINHIVKLLRNIWYEIRNAKLTELEKAQQYINNLKNEMAKMRAELHKYKVNATLLQLFLNEDL